MQESTCLREFTFSLTYAGGGTEALVIEAESETEARKAIQKIYPSARLNWII
jgi:hypothetical protein